MVEIDISDIKLLDCIQAPTEAVTLIIPENFRLLYGQYRYYFLCLVQNLSTDELQSERCEVAVLALQSLLDGKAIDPFALIKAEIALFFLGILDSMPAKFIENAENFFQKYISAAEICHISTEYSKFMLLMSSKSRRTRWDDVFEAPLYVLYHIFQRESEPSSVGYPFGNLVFRSYASSEDNVLKFPLLSSYGDWSAFALFWFQRLQPYSVKAPITAYEITLSESGEAEPSKRKFSVDIINHLIKEHEKLICKFVSSLLSCQVPKAQSAVQRRKVGQDNQNTSGLHSENPLRGAEWFPPSVASIASINWPNRKETQMKFLMQCAVVNVNAYRQQILAHELEKLQNKVPNLHQEKVPEGKYSTHLYDTTISKKSTHHPHTLEGISRAIAHKSLYAQSFYEPISMECVLSAHSALRKENSIFPEYEIAPSEE